jgi:tetraprenyl-beta-curcumene synthase
VCRPAPSALSIDQVPVATVVGTIDPAPISVRQLAHLACCVTRELVWGLRFAARELGIWRSRAMLIPDKTIREDALSALGRKRGNTDGAALFWVIPDVRNPPLLKLLVTYQIMWDFLDTVSETGAAAGQANGRQLHLALVDAVDRERPISDYYRLHPWDDDGDYLRSLVKRCRALSVGLPSFESVRPLLIREAYRANVQAINHDLDPARRERALRGWVTHEYDRSDVHWFELAAGAGAGLSIYALFALAVQPCCTETEIYKVYNAYFPWASAVATMLDSYVDQVEDAANGDHIYIEHYQSPSSAHAAIGRLIKRSLREVGGLSNGERHLLLIASMVTMYLSKNSARAPAKRGSTSELVRAGGSLTRALLPVLRLWRTAYAQRAN